MKSSISWFEIPTRDLGAAQAFYQSLLGCSMRREAMGPSEGAVFPYEGEGIGGALICGPSANAPSAGGVVVYLDCSPSLDAACSVQSPPGVLSPCRAEPCHRAWVLSR